MIVLGIESSCDDTGVGIVGDGAVLAGRMAAQSDLHSAYGGVVPEIASRAHLEVADALVSGALSDAGLGAQGVDLFAAGAGPGLIGGVIVGLNLAKAMAFALKKPFVAVNHLEAHALMPMMFEPGLKFPYLLFLASGGHTQLLHVLGVGRYRLLGATVDDAVGECFDKVAKMLGYDYMGGKFVERDAEAGNPAAFGFPRPLLRSKDLNFSFSGLKTAVRLAVEKGGAKKEDVAASFQRAVVDVVAAKARRALGEAEVSSLVASGGVAANKAIRAALAGIAAEFGVPFFAAPPEYCTDNGVMIAYAGAMEFAARGPSPLDVSPRPRWPLEEL
ncbi:MAG: tRNA (adenosine(37)-N6)-threonylcarbamoyltransferase complex transferase subunit TsaD [Rickettsiales bacterium]|jgi:N6-L-threonylcarbamoyladenine synthase|nr:tRNA (adenosine(37)-N6)-threonylcarbamoyltransferase complex transferase subunit TsaD [Rickettsiales bacterium]